MIISYVLLIPSTFSEYVYFFCQINTDVCDELICENDGISGKYNAFLYDTLESNVKVLGYQKTDIQVQWTDIVIDPDADSFILNTNLFDLPDDYNNLF